MFLGNESVRTNILVPSQVMEQVNTFSYLNFEYNRDCKNKINKFGYVCGTINKNVTHKTHEVKGIKSLKP